MRRSCVMEKGRRAGGALAISKAARLLKAYLFG